VTAGRAGRAVFVQDRQRAFRVPAPAIRRAAGAALDYAGPLPGGLSIVVVGHREMRQLNRRFARVSGTTDVLAFDLSGGPAPSHDDIAGEVVVNAELALSQAARRRCAPRRELLLYVVHGVLHLCGYGDSTPARKKRMRQAEAAVLRRLAPRKRIRCSCRSR